MMNFSSMITEINALIYTIRKNWQDEEDIQDLIRLSPGHYFDMVLERRKLESPLHSIKAIDRALEMMDENNALVDYFLHRLCAGNYDRLISPLLRIPNEKSYINEFAKRVADCHRVPKLAGKIVRLANVTKQSERLNAEMISHFCHQVSTRSIPADISYAQCFWHEYRKDAQIRETLIHLCEKTLEKIDNFYKQRAFTSFLTRGFFDVLKGSPIRDIVEVEPLTKLPLSAMQDSFNMAFSLTRDYFDDETQKQGGNHSSKEVREHIAQAAGLIQEAFKKRFGISLEKPKRILNALETMQATQPQKRFGSIPHLAI